MLKHKIFIIIVFIIFFYNLFLIAYLQLINGSIISNFLSCSGMYKKLIASLNLQLLSQCFVGLLYLIYLYKEEKRNFFFLLITLLLLVPFCTFHLLCYLSISERKKFFLLPNYLKKNFTANTSIITINDVCIGNSVKL